LQRRLHARRRHPPHHPRLGRARTVGESLDWYVDRIIAAKGDASKTRISGGRRQHGRHVRRGGLDLASQALATTKPSRPRAASTSTSAATGPRTWKRLALASAQLDTFPLSVRPRSSRPSW
jgi:hypothetical protein